MHHSVKHHKKAYVACRESILAALAGNSFLMRCTHLFIYASTTTIPAKAQKAMYSKIIYDEIRAMAPPGRFLKQDPKTKLWSDIGEKKALDKTRQALREGAPDMLKGMGGGGGGDESGDSGDDYSRSRSEALGSMHASRHEAVEITPTYGGHETGSIVAAALQLQLQQQQMQLANQGSNFTPEFNAQLQLLKMQLQMNAQCMNPNTANQEHQRGVGGGIRSNGNNMGNNQNMHAMLSASQATNNAGGSNTMHPNQVNSFLAAIQNSSSSASGLYNNIDNVSSVAYQLQQQQQIAQFAMLNAAMNRGGFMNANYIHDRDRTFMRGHLMRGIDDSQQQRQPNRQTQVIIDTPVPSMIESDDVVVSNIRRPGNMRGLNSNSFATAQRIGVNDNGFRNGRNSLRSSGNSLKSSFMSTEGLFLDDLDGEAMEDVFDNQGVQS